MPRDHLEAPIRVVNNIEAVTSNGNEFVALPFDIELPDEGERPGEAAEDAAAYRVPVTPSLDGNTVELSTEQTLFAENAVQYRTTLAFLEGRISTLKRALKGE